jgi:hypothetical protein
MSTRTSFRVRAERLKSLIRRPLLPVYLLEGEFQGGRLRVVVADDGATLGYFRRLAFPVGSSLSRRGVVSAFRAADLASSDADLVVIGANHFLLGRYAGRGFSFAPKYVQLQLSVYDEPDVMIDKLRGSGREDLKRNVRRMLEKGFDWEVTKKDEWFDLFYYRMYKPFAENKHGELARVHDYRAIRKDFRRGAGISITRDGNPVAGAITYIEDSTMFNPSKGILHGDDSIARDGASVALYYYCIRLAHSSGCKTADFGFSSPFLSDGTLSYKLKWGMGVPDLDDSKGVYAIASPGRTEQAVKFLRANRFFCLTPRGIEVCNDY